MDGAPGSLHLDAREDGLTTMDEGAFMKLQEIFSTTEGASNGDGGTYREVRDLVVIKAGAVNISSTGSETTKIPGVQKTGIGSPIKHSRVEGRGCTMGVPECG